MAGRSFSCLRCGGAMEQGYLLDEGYGRQRPGKWIEGAPEYSMWTGIKLRGRRQLEIASYRCSRCGYLESYAEEG